MIRVLHLAPATPDRDRITAHSFIDEEILALRDTGVGCFVLSDAASSPETRRGIPIIPVPMNPGIAETGAAVAFAARHALRIGWQPSAFEVFHAIRIEMAAARAVERHGIDVVHSHFAWPAGFGGSLASAEARVPLVASLRGMDLLTSPALGYGLRRDAGFDRALRRLLSEATRTIYATEFMRAEGLEAGAPRDRAAVIRKGVDLARFRPAANRPAARRALGLNAPLVLAVGTLIPRKRYRLLLDALAPLAALPWTLVLCGEGPDRQMLEAHALALGLRDRVQFAGRVDRNRIAQYFSAADLFVHPAEFEAAGNVILEALASGTPVVCTGGTGPQEYVVDGQTGFVVDAGDCPGITDRMRRLLEQPELHACLSMTARAAAENLYGYGRMIGDYAAVYESCRQSAPRRDDAAAPLRPAPVTARLPRPYAARSGTGSDR